MICIFCNKENNATSIEHIVPESFGNEKYVMERGRVCDTCNARFSGFEGSALANSIFAMERARLGIKTKKGKNVKGKIGDLKVQGDWQFRKQMLTVKGLNEDNFREYDPQTGIGKLVVSAFNKSEVAASKMLLKMGSEAIYTSRRAVFDKYNFGDLKDFLAVVNNIDWPFLTTNIEYTTAFVSIPRFTDKYNLQRRFCVLRFAEVDSNTLLFNFKFGAVSMLINLLKRDLAWIDEAMKADGKAILYPDHYRRKLSRRAHAIRN